MVAWAALSSVDCLHYQSRNELFISPLVGSNLQQTVAEQTVRHRRQSNAIGRVAE